MTGNRIEIEGRLIDQPEVRLTPAGTPVLRFTVECGAQGIEFALSAVEFLREQKPVWRVLLAEREGVDPVLRLPCGKAAPEVARQAGRGLVALLGGLGEQLQDDGREYGRDSRQPLAGRRWLSGDVAVDPLHGIGRGERQ